MSSMKRESVHDENAHDENLAPVSYLPWADPAVPAEDDADRAARALLEAENVLTRRLRARALSVAESYGVLAETEASAEQVDELIERYQRIGYIDERHLAEQIVHSHHERKGLGRSAVEAEMRRRKIDHAVIAEVIDELDVDESAPAAALAEKRIRSMSSLDDETASRRLSGFLLRKGYSSSVARDAVRAAFTTAGRTAR